MKAGIVSPDAAHANADGVSVLSYRVKGGDEGSGPHAKGTGKGLSVNGKRSRMGHDMPR